MAEKQVEPQSYLMKSLFCAGGIMVSLILYGVLQERIMTQAYGDEQFRNSAYLVFNNRIVAVLIAIFMILIRREKAQPGAPVLNFSGVSLSNTMATYCQYEALKYVTFPTQTLGKCGKMIPVMLTGICISGKSYGAKDFGYAFAVSVGCAIFLLSGDISQTGQIADESIFGLVLMGAYLFFDGFTSTLQEKLFKGHEMSTYNQMLYVNAFSALISLASLIFSDTFFSSLMFSLHHVDFLWNSFLLSICSTCGQMVILYTIKELGALFFATVMTLRQMISMILSCLLYSHPLSITQWASAIFVFGILYYKDATKQPHGHGHGSKKPTPVEKPVPSDIIEMKEVLGEETK